MDSLIAKDLPYVQSVYWRIKKQFPQVPLKIIWEPVSEAFWILTNDFALYRSKEYLELIYTLYGETLNATYYEIKFSRLSFEHNFEELDCGSAEGVAEEEVFAEAQVSVEAQSPVLG